MQPDTKPALYSKTLWVNLIMGLTAIFVPSVNTYMQAHPEVVTMIFTGVNVVLRLISKDKLSLN
jgi:hypothetical protein